MAYRGKFDLEYEDQEEERLFIRTRRLAGHHIAMVKMVYPPEAYSAIMGEHWNDPEPLGRGSMGTWGMALRYATIDDWYKQEGIKKGRFTEQEVNRFYNAWKGKVQIPKDLPLSNADILKFWRENRKDPQKVQQTRQRRKKARRTKSYEKRFAQDRNPSVIYRQLESALPSSSALDARCRRRCPD